MKRESCRLNSYAMEMHLINCVLGKVAACTLLPLVLWCGERPGTWRTSSIAVVEQQESNF